MPITTAVHHPSRLAIFAIHGHLTFQQAAQAFEAFAKAGDHQPDYNEIAPIHPMASFDNDLMHNMYRLLDVTKDQLERPKQWHPAVAFICSAQQRTSLVELYAVIGESRNDIGRRYAFFAGVEEAAAWVERAPAEVHAALVDVGAQRPELSWMPEEFG